MPAYYISDEIKFILNHYDSICNDMNKIPNIYLDSSKVSIFNEYEKPEVSNSNSTLYYKSKMQKSIFKILLSSVNSQNIDESFYLITTVGQMVFVDRSQKRFTHAFVLKKKDNLFYISNEVLTFLNEEISYERIDKRFTFAIDNKYNKDITDILIDIRKYGKIESAEEKEGYVNIRIRPYDLSNEEIGNEIQKKGYRIVTIN